MTMTTDDQGNEIGKLFVGGLHQSTMNENLKSYFCQFGEVQEASVMMDHKTGRSRGFGYVKFADAESVNKVVAAAKHLLDGKEIDPKPCNVNMKGKSRRSLKVFVGGIAPEHNEETLREYFKQFGNLTELTLMKDPSGHRHRGFAFVGYDDEAVVKQLIADHFLTIGTKQVEIKPMEPQAGRNNTMDLMGGGMAMTSGKRGMGINSMQAGQWPQWPTNHHQANPNSAWVNSAGAPGSHWGAWPTSNHNQAGWPQGSMNQSGSGMPSSSTSAGIWEQNPAVPGWGASGTAGGGSGLGNQGNGTANMSSSLVAGSSANRHHHHPHHPHNPHHDMQQSAAAWETTPQSLWTPNSAGSTSWEQQWFAAAAVANHNNTAPTADWRNAAAVAAVAQQQHQHHQTHLQQQQHHQHHHHLSNGNATNAPPNTQHHISHFQSFKR